LWKFWNIYLLYFLCTMSYNLLLAWLMIVTSWDLTTTIMLYTQRSYAPVSHHMTLMLPGHRSMVCGTKWHTEQCVTPHTWWGLTLEIRRGTSRVPHRVLSTSVIDTNIDQTRYSYYPVHIRCVKLCDIRNKVPRHAHGGGHLLRSVGAPLESHITCLVYQSYRPRTWYI